MEKGGKGDFGCAISILAKHVWPKKVDKVANVEPGGDMMADMQVDVVANINIDIDINININMDIQFGESVGHGCWLIGPGLRIF